MWWTFIWWGWEETASVHSWCLAHTCYYGLLPSRSKHTSGQLAHCSLQVNTRSKGWLPYYFTINICRTITDCTHLTVCLDPQQHLLWSQVHFQSSVEVPEISAHHDFSWPSHLASTSHHLQSPLHPLQQAVSPMRQEETGGRDWWEGSRP